MRNIFYFFSALVVIGCTDAAVTEAPLSPNLAKAGATSGPVVNSTNPSGTAPGRTLDVRILGSGFESGTQASFALKGAAAGIVTNRTTLVSSRELIANITVSADADIALYDVIVVTPGGKKGIGTEMFEVAYLAIDLGVDGTGEAVAVNEKGQIAGWYRDRKGKQYPFIWENGVVTKLPVAGYVRDINDQGWVLGFSLPRSWIWRPESGVEWIDPPTGDSYFQAEAMNNSGVITGRSSPRGVVVWTGSEFIDVAAMLGGGGTGWGINDAGVVVGTFAGGNFRYTPGVGVETLATINGGEALDINDHGQIAGWHTFPGSAKLSAFVWTDGIATEAAAPGANGSLAFAVANSGLGVGRNGSGRAFWWTPWKGEVQLGSLRASTSSQAFDVNEQGWIVGKSGDRPALWRQ